MALEPKVAYNNLTVKIKNEYGQDIIEEVRSGDYLFLMLKGYVPTLGVVRQIALTKLEIDFTDYNNQFMKTKFDKLDMKTLREFLNHFKKWSTKYAPFYFGSFNPAKTNSYKNIIQKYVPNVVLQDVKTPYGNVIYVSHILEVDL